MSTNATADARRDARARIGIAWVAAQAIDRAVAARASALGLPPREAYLRALADLTGDAKLANSILRMAVEILRRGGEHGLAVSVLAHIVVGQMALRDPAAAGSPVARFAGTAVAVVGWWGESAWNSAKDWAGDKLSGAWSKVKEAVGDVADMAKEIAKGSIDGLNEFARKLGGQGLKIAKAVLRLAVGRRLADAMIEMIPVIFDTARAIATDVIRGLIRAVRFLGQGKPKDAMVEMLVASFMVFLTPALGPIGLAFGLSDRRLSSFLRRIARDNPLMPLQIVSVALSAVSANIQQVAVNFLALLRPIVGALLRELGGVAGRVSAAATDVVFGGLQMVLLGAVPSLDEVVDMVATRIGAATAQQKAAVRALFGRAMTRLLRLDLGGFASVLGELVKVPDIGRAKGYLGEMPLSAMLDRPDADRTFAAALVQRPETARAIIVRLAMGDSSASRIWRQAPA